MGSLRRVQRPFEELLRSNVAIVARGAQQAWPVRLHRLLLNALQNLGLALCKLVEVVDEIYQEEFPAELFREGGLHPEIKLASPERVLAVALVIIDDGLVVE